MSIRSKYRLRKIDYMNYLACPPEFWLSIREPLLSPREDETLEYTHLRQQGYEVEWLVKQMPKFQSNGAQFVEFQRTFQTQNLYARTDVCVTDLATGLIDIYEIKGSSSVKDEHYDDVAFQKYVAESSGFPIGRCFVITLNSEYVRRGDIVPEELFVITDVTDEVNFRRDLTERQVAEAFAYLESVPVPSLMEYCAANKLDCKFLRLHFPDLPDYTVFDISYLKNEKRRELLSQGIVAITDVPDSFPLSDKQKRQVAAAKSGEIVIDREAIANRMCEWKYPMHFLDYETFSYAIPQYDGIRPFQQMCFQYSLHTIDAEGAPMRHSAFLACNDETDPPRAMAEHLRDAMSGGIGTVFVWYEGFEKTRNEEMAEMYPDLADFFREVNEKTCDLMKIFADRLYIHPEFKGRSSIKKVLPVLCPHLRYDELGIKEGLTASISWFRAVRRKMQDEERNKVFTDLEAYCELDTKAMVEIYNVLRSL